MAIYQTQQRRDLLEYLARHTDEAFNAKRVAEALREKGVSVSAVYRNLAALEKDGRIRRIVTEDSHETMYQFVDHAACRNKLHLVCTNCGKMAHLEQAATESIFEEVRRCEHFRLNRQETVLYGLCEACSL